MRSKAGLFLRYAVVLFGTSFCDVAWAVDAVVVDRYGNQHNVERFTYQGRQEMEVYIGDQRRILPFNLVDRMRFEGEPSDEEQVVSLQMRSGKRQKGTVISGGGAAPHQDAIGGGVSGRRFTGSTSLGPFFILVGDVRELILQHPEGEEVPQELVLKATIITLEGKRFEVEDLRFRGKQRLDFYRGRNKRFIPLDKVDKIDFDDSGAAEEFRPITATYWNGRTVMGTVDAGIVRLSGETDKSFYDRVNAALTARISTGPFSIGMHHIKQIRFKRNEREESQAD